MSQYNLDSKTIPEHENKIMSISIMTTNVKILKKKILLNVVLYLKKCHIKGGLF